jgi:hypothetical protein
MFVVEFDLGYLEVAAPLGLVPQTILERPLGVLLGDEELCRFRVVKFGERIQTQRLGRYSATRGEASVSRSPPRRFGALFWVAGEGLGPRQFPRPFNATQAREKRLSESREQRQAQNQLIFRSVNQEIKRLSEKLLDARSDLEFVCECDDPACIKRMRMQLAEFTEFDRMENCFIVVPGHEDAEVEEVMTRHKNYLVVAKVGVNRESVRDSS